jgi:hypothetical protein
MLSVQRRGYFSRLKIWIRPVHPHRPPRTRPVPVPQSADPKGIRSTMSIVPVSPSASSADSPALAAELDMWRTCFLDYGAGLLTAAEQGDPEVAGQVLYGLLLDAAQRAAREDPDPEAASGETAARLYASLNTVRRRYRRTVGAPERATCTVCSFLGHAALGLLPLPC